MQITYNANGTVTVTKANGATTTILNDETLSTKLVELSDPAPIPKNVTPLQIRKAIRNAPNRATLLTKITALTEEEKEEWEFALFIDRNNAAIKGLNLTEVQLDSLFRLAATF